MATGDPNHVNRRRADDWGWGVWGIFWLFLLFMLFFAGWGWGGWWWHGPWWQARAPVAQHPGTPAIGPQPGTPPATTQALPGEFQGRTITVRGAVKDVLGDHAVTLAAPHEAGGHDLLVVARPEATVKAGLKKGEQVQATGTIQTFDRAAFAREANADLSGDRFTPFVGRPALLANRVGEPQNYVRATP